MGKRQSKPEKVHVSYQPKIRPFSREELMRQASSLPEDRNELFLYSLETETKLDVKNQEMLQLLALIPPFMGETPVDLSRFSILGNDADFLDVPHSGCFLPLFEDSEKATVKAARETVQEMLKDGEGMSTNLSKALGCVFGMASGDALGHTLEFRPVRYNVESGDRGYLGEMKGGGKFQLHPGQWTDDTSMGLCIMDSLLMTGARCDRNVHIIDGFDLMLRFEAWWHLGYNNAFGYDPTRQPKHSVGLGGNISLALKRYIKEGVAVTQAGDKETSGNGSIMRLAPIPVYFWQTPELACKAARESSITTHQGEEAAECARLLAHICSTAINLGDKATVESILGDLGDTFHSDDERVMFLARAEREPGDDNDRDWRWKGPDYRYAPERSKLQPGYIGSYAMDCLSMALHCVWTTESFNAAVLKCVNMAGDADTVGSVCGQIAGAIYGFEAVPSEWVKRIQQWDRNGDIALKTVLLFNQVDLGS